MARTHVRFPTAAAVEIEPRRPNYPAIERAVEISTSNIVVSHDGKSAVFDMDISKRLSRSEVASFIGHLYEKAARDPYNVKMTDVEVQQIAEQKFVVTAGSHVRGVSKRELVRVENAFVHKLVSFKAAIESEDKPILTKRA